MELNPGKPSVAKKTVEHLRRLFLRRSPRPQTNTASLRCEPAIVQRFSLAESAAVMPGSRESTLQQIDGRYASICLRKDPVCCSLMLVQDKRPGQSNVKDGLSPSTIGVLNGTLQQHPVVCAEIAPAVELCVDTKRMPVVFEAKIGTKCDLGLTRPELLSVNSQQILMDAPEAVKQSLIERTMKRSFVKIVPKHIEAATPLIRKRDAGPSENTLAAHAAYLTERQLLAQVAGDCTTARDILIVGIFSHVPLSCASRIAIGPGPAKLSIYLRPKSGKMVQFKNRQLYSIAFGRIKGKKEIVRVLIPETHN
jgi:hypothetical protein